MDKELIQFRIDAYTPSTIPMARLAEYLSQLATLYGSRESVHFDKLLKGSAIVQAWVPSTEGDQVISRIRRANSEDAPEEVRRAYLRIDSMLRENRAVGEIKRKKGGKILQFPGRKLPEPKAVQVVEHGEIDGVIVRVGGTDNTIPVHLQSADGATFPCQVRDRGMARELAPLLYGDPVRVRGQGVWERSPQGAWKLLSMTIDGWETLDTSSAIEVFNHARGIPGNGWKAIADIDREVSRIREGR